MLTTGITDIIARYLLSLHLCYYPFNIKAHLVSDASPSTVVLAPGLALVVGSAYQTGKFNSVFVLYWNLVKFHPLTPFLSHLQEPVLSL